MLECKFAIRQDLEGKLLHQSQLGLSWLLAELDTNSIGTVIVSKQEADDKTGEASTAKYPSLS